MSKIYIIQSYNTCESDLYCVSPDYIENIITSSKEEAEKICNYIDEYNELMTGVDDIINSNAKIVEIDLGNTQIDFSAKCFETLDDVKENYPLPEEDEDDVEEI